MSTPNRSAEAFKKRMSRVAEVVLINHTGEVTVPVLDSGTKAFSILLNGQKHVIHYPKAGCMRVLNEGTIAFLDRFNGTPTLTCRFKTYHSGLPVPHFADFPEEEEEYGRKKKKVAA